jgi:hypothetical protein
MKVKPVSSAALATLLCACAASATLQYACAATYGAKHMGALPYVLKIRLHIGDRLLERADEIDRIEWKLPEKRLEHFRKGGVIINEQQRISSDVRSSVVWAGGGVARLLAHAYVTSIDVPRHTHESFEQTFTTSLRANNVGLSSQPPPVEAAAMAQLPSTAIILGQHWQTREAVTTSLGSGFVVFDHEATSVDNGLLRIAVRGRGEITGAEYHLPKLLPGSIDVTGAAWYNLQMGLITQESYVIHNRLLRPMEGVPHGFDEILTVDVRERKQQGL